MKKIFATRPREIKADGKLEELFLKSLKEDSDKYTKEDCYFKSPQHDNYYFKIKRASVYIGAGFAHEEHVYCYIDGEEVFMGRYNEGEKCYKFAELIEAMLRNTWAKIEQQKTRKIDELVSKITA
jgi:hypothetical protein